MPYMGPDFKPARRHRATRSQWDKIWEQFKGSSCRLCGEPYKELHHLYRKGMGGAGGDDVPSNLIPLCKSCHRAIERHDPVARNLLRKRLSLKNIDYLRWKFGDQAVGWLDANYPAEEAA